MRAAVPTAELAALIAERARLGIDTFDEVWDGECRMNAAPHPRHRFLLRHVIRILDPLAEALGLVSLGEFNLGTASGVASAYHPTDRSAILDLTAADLAARLPWERIES